MFMRMLAAAFSDHRAHAPAHRVAHLISGRSHATLGAVGRAQDPKRRWSRQFDDELVGLDPDDPEAQAFAKHLDRMQSPQSGFTVEGYLAGVTDFAESANRAEGGRRWAAVFVVLALLAVAAYITWEALVFVLHTWM
jgi:hypothetical protein